MQKENDHHVEHDLTRTPLKWIWIVYSRKSHGLFNKRAYRPIDVAHNLYKLC